MVKAAKGKFHKSLANAMKQMEVKEEARSCRETGPRATTQAAHTAVQLRVIAVKTCYVLALCMLVQGELTALFCEEFGVRRKGGLLVFETFKMLVKRIRVENLHAQQQRGAISTKIFIAIGFYQVLTALVSGTASGWRCAVGAIPEIHACMFLAAPS